MVENRLEEKLISLLGQDKVLRQEPMARHCSFCVGGPADYYIRIDRIDQLKKTLHILQTEKEPFFVLGRGTNLLVADKGYRGAVITLAGDKDAAAREGGQQTELAAFPDQIVIHGREVIAGAGASLAAVAAAACEHGLAGLEFASGIPGSVGGGLVMNAGAYGAEMKDVVREAVLLMPDGQIRKLLREELHFGYRRSLLKEIPAIALQVVFVLAADAPETIRARMQDLSARRRAKQPLEYPSAGSTFKRPEGYFAGKLIEDAGLAGYTVGGACVSTKHCGFVINKDHASTADIRQVIRDVQDKVYATAGVRLEPEVIFLGEE